ncbi:MAG: hypothetical protein ACRDPD_26505 [Streptosporangiaceae bacterium]
MVAVAIGMGLVFAAGVILGFIVTISMASHREDRLGTLTRQPPDAVARGARRLYGLGTRDITPRATRGVQR